MSSQTRTVAATDSNHVNKSQLHGSASRRDLVEQLESVGLNVNALDALPIHGLESLREGIFKLLARNPSKGPGRPKGSIGLNFRLSNLDKKILSLLLSSEGHISSLELSIELHIPLSTIQRRRRRIEENLQRNYSLDVSKFGWKTVILFVCASDGKTAQVGKEMLLIDENVTSITRMMGANDMDLKVEVVFKTDEELLSLLERIKSIDGVKSVLWSELIEIVGRNNKPYQRIINSQ